jgi:hypothetical protein
MRFPDLQCPQAASLDDIKRVANQYFGGKPHAVVIVTPSEKKE